MIVIIPAAGEGKRLAEIQPGVPKALKQINGQAMIYYTLAKLAELPASGLASEATLIVVSGKYETLFYPFVAFELYDAIVRCVIQPGAYGTGDAVWRALDYLGGTYDGPVLIMYPDVLTNSNLYEFISRGNAVMTKPRDGNGSCVYRCPSELERVISVSEKPRIGMGNVYEKLGDWYYVENAMYLYIALKCLGGLTWTGYQGVRVSAPQKSAKEFSLTQGIDALMRCGIPFRGVRVDDYCSLGNPEGFNKAEEWLKNHVQK